MGPSSVKPCQSVHAAPPGAFILSITQPFPSSSPLRPIKGWFSTPAGQPWRLAARDRWEAREAGKGWGGQWASIWAQGVSWAPASNRTENSPALTCWPESACGYNHTHTHSLRIYLTPTNTYTTRPLDFNGIYSLTLWQSCINKTLKNVEATHFINQFNNMLFRHLQWT